MKFKIVTIFIALIFFIAQPVSISKADLASDLLKKAQELAEKQKIKGKKLEAFILSNIITVDYEGKEQTYKFNKDITYNVYENSKVIGDGTWTIKGLTKSSIKLSGYRNIYFQIYSAKDRISTLTNLKKKSDGQTNRKILKISSLDDFEEQLANSKTKKEKKKVKKEEVKKKVKKEEVKKKVKKEVKKEECDKWVKNRKMTQEEVDNLPMAFRAFRVANGHLNVENYEHALILLEIAAEQGHAWAQFNLGTIYEFGDSTGAVRRPKLAFMWYTMSIYEYYRIDKNSEIQNSHRKKCYSIKEKSDGDPESTFNEYLETIKERLYAVYDKIDTKDKKDIPKEKEKFIEFADLCWEKKFINCGTQRNYFNYAKDDKDHDDLEKKLLKEHNLFREKIEEIKKVKLSRLRDCPVYNSSLMYQEKWINCFGSVGLKLYDGGTLKYVGEFGPNTGQASNPGLRGYFHGNGTLTFQNRPSKDMTKYIGQFENGSMHGQGKMYFKDGSIYDGTISEEIFNGPGKLTDSDGNILKEGIWENGNLTQSKKVELAESKQLKNCDTVQELFAKNVSKKTVTLGGYKHIHFGMSREDVNQIIDCKKIRIFDKDEFNGNAGYGDRGIVLNELYKYPLGVIFKKNETGPGSTVDKLSLQVVSTIRTKERYSFKSSGIEEFEELKKTLSNKYKLIIKPSDTSIDQYNNAAVSGTLKWVFNSNDSENLIILSLQGIKGADYINYIYSGEVHYLSPDQSKNYLSTIDSVKIKSDDL